MSGLEVSGTDDLLLPFLMSEEEAEREAALNVIFTEHALPIIRNIIRRKLRVSLAERDGSRENQDAMEVCGEVQAALLIPEDDEIVCISRTIQAPDAPCACNHCGVESELGLCVGNCLVGRYRSHLAPLHTNSKR